MKVVFKKMFADAVLPKYQRDGDSALDCYAAETIKIGVGERIRIPLGFGVEIPIGYKGEVLGRSGNNLKGLEVITGTIDSNYRGEVSATVVNRTGFDVVVNKGDRVSQFDIVVAPVIEILEVENLTETIRGVNGYGSSGK